MENGCSCEERLRKVNFRKCVAEAASALFQASGRIPCKNSILAFVGPVVKEYHPSYVSTEVTDARKCIGRKIAQKEQARYLPLFDAASIRLEYRVYTTTDNNVQILYSAIKNGTRLASRPSVEALFTSLLSEVLSLS